MVTLNAVMDYTIAGILAIPVGSEYEIHAMTKEETLHIKRFFTGEYLLNIPCSVFGLTPEEIKILIDPKIS